MEHLTQKQIEDYSQHRLDAATLLTVDDHLAACDACRSQVEVLIGGETAFFALHSETLGDESSPHLTADETAEFVDRNLSGDLLQTATDHLAVCAQCAMAVEDLRAFRNEIAPSLDREYHPAPLSPPVARESWLTKFGSLFRASPVPAFGGAALGVVLAAVIIWLVWRSPREQEPQIVSAPTPVSQPSPSSAPSPLPEQTPTVVAQLNDGGRVLALDQDGTLSGADDLPAAYKNLLTRALSTQRIEKSSRLEGLSRPPSSLMSSGNQKDQFAVLEPVGKVLLTDKPGFRWSNLDGATGYVVEVYDEQFRLVAASPQLTDTTWTTTLARGQVYSWQVKAMKDGQEITSPRPPAPQAKFRVLDREKANEVIRARRVYGSSHLTLGLLYAEAGLLDEAERELRLVQRANPGSDLAASLLRQVQALRR